MEAQGLQFERSGGMSAESDRRDGEDDGRSPQQANDDRSGDTGTPRGRQGGGRSPSGGFQNRNGGRPRRDGRPREGGAGPGAGARGRTGPRGGSSRYPKDRDSSNGRDDTGRTGSRRPRPYRADDSEGSFRDRPKRRDTSSGSYGERDGSRRTPRAGGRRFEGKDDGRSPRSPGASRGSDRQGENRGVRAPRRDGAQSGRSGGLQRRQGENRDARGPRRDGTQPRGGGGFQRRANSDPRGESASGRRDDKGGRTGAGRDGRPPRREGAGGERRSAAPRGGFERRDDALGGRREGSRPADGAAGRGGGRPAGRGRGPADRPRRPYERDGRTPAQDARPPRDPGPAVPADVTGEELDRAAKSELRTLPKELATEVARHLVMAGRLVDEDPELAYQHTLAARRRAARVGVVREACGLAAYHAGLWSVALAELRAARRLTGQEAYLAIMADAERGLGRPERALDLARSDEARRLPQAEAIEMRIVESGARRDLGQHGAAVLALQVPELKDDRLRPWSARLFYAYADALVEAGRGDEATDWFARAAAADRDGETDAAERYAEMEGLDIIDHEDLDED